LGSGLIWSHGESQVNTVWEEGVSDGADDIPLTGNSVTSVSMGSNSVQLRHYNERVVLDSLRREGEASKAQLARIARLTPPAISGIVDSLVAAGLVEARGKRFGGKGQPSAMFGIKPDGAFAVGLHLGRRSLDGVLLGFDGETLLFEQFEHDFPDPEEVRQRGNQILRSFRKHLGDKAGKLIGLGISAPYFLGSWEKELGTNPETQGRWRDIDLTSHFDAQGLPIFVENDASAAAAAELVFGAGKYLKDFVHLSINTMIGGGLVMDGVLQTGPNGNAAAYGPMPVTPSRLTSTPPTQGPFEILLRRASIYVLMRHLAASGSKVVRVRELDPMPADARQPFTEWQDDCAAALAQAIVSTISVIDVEAIVIDGLLPRHLMQETTAKVRAELGRVMPTGVVAPDIIDGTLGARASAIGAAILPLYMLFAPDSAILTRKGTGNKPLMVRSTG
jgi:predicted NBD/HSP70 family sugar kinase